MGEVIYIDGDPVNAVADLWQYTATNYTDLTTVVAPIALEGELAIVYETQGVWILGTRKEAGIYVFLSGTWVYFTQELKDEIKANDVDIQDIVDGFLTNDVIINSESDWIDVSGKNKLENKIYHVADSVTITKPFDVSAITGSCYLIMRSITTYSGSGALFQGTLSGSFELDDGGFINTSSQPVFNISGTGVFTNLFIARRSGFAGFSSRGKIENIGGALLFGRIQFIDCGLGLIVKDCAAVNLDFDVTNSLATNSPQLVLDNVFGDILLRGGSLTLQSGDSMFQFSSNIVVSKAFVTEFPFDISSGAEFLASAKSNTGVAFSDNGSGKLRISSVAHGLTIEQVLVTSNSTLHDGTFDVLSIVDANTIDLDTSFLGVDTGDWTTGDSNDFLDDTRFDFKSNGDQIDTNEISKYKSLNTITIAPLVIGTPVPITGVLVDWSGIIDRRFITNFPGDPVGTSRYIGTKPLLMRVSQRISVDPQGGSAKDISGCITINGVDQADSIYKVNTSREVTLNPEDVIQFQPNDVIGSAVANDTDLGLLDVTLVNNNTIKA